MKYLKILMLLNLIFQYNFSNAQPSREWATYFGGDLTVIGNVAYDPVSNCVYVAGVTADSIDIATLGAFKEIGGPFNPELGLPPSSASSLGLALWNKDFFLSKFDMEGNLLWSTYIGGIKQERSAAMKVDHLGNIYIAGLTLSEDNIATAGTHLSSKIKVAPDTLLSYFITKFDSTGNRIWGTYYGDSCLFGMSHKIDIVVDNSEQVYITGGTEGIAFTTTGSFMPSDTNGVGKAVVAKFSKDGHLLWGTYYGGESVEGFAYICIDNDDYVYTVGPSFSKTNIATPGVYQESIIDSTVTNSMLIKWDTLGNRIWGTYIAGSKFIYAYSLCIDADNNVYVYGTSKSPTNIGTIGTHQPVYADSVDAFIMKFSPTGQKIWGTYFGGNNMEEIYRSTYNYGYVALNNSIQFDENSNAIYISGSTRSPNNIGDSCSYEVGANPGGYLAKFDTSGSLIWSNYYDADIFDISLSPAKNDESNDIYLVGQTRKNGLATPGAFKETKVASNRGSIIAKFKDKYKCVDSINLEYDGFNLNTDTSFTNYTWYHNGIPIAGANNATYNPGIDTIGYYYVIAEICDCQVKSDTFYFTPTSISENSLQNNWMIYPNPANEILNINYAKSLQIPYNITITDIAGKEVLRIENEKDNNKAIDISQLLPAIYFIKLESKEGFTVKKFVKI